jgi:hypothetical protein
MQRQQEGLRSKFKATTLRIEFEAITTLKNHLDNAEAARRTKVKIQSYHAKNIPHSLNYGKNY